MFSRRAAAEFPNDNPELHDGLVWVPPEPVGRALPTLRLRPLAGAMPRVLGPSWERDGDDPPRAIVRAVARDPAAGDATASDITLVAPPAVLDAPNDEPAEALPAPDAPFTRFVAALVAVALARGGTRAAAALGGLLEQGRVAPGAFDDATLKRLISARILARSGTHATPEFRATSEAWRGVLDATTADLAACGAATLDSWAAELVAAVLDAPSGAVPDLRRALRRAGIAAFGLLAVA